MALNGALAGLVSITAGPDLTNHFMSMIIGAIGGVIVVIAIPLLDKMKIDDVVGAISVHLVAGVWGTLAVGIFSAEHSLLTQAIGVLAYGAISFPAALLIFVALKRTVGLRVTPEEEAMGLDLGEHGMEAYGGFIGGTTAGGRISDRAAAPVGLPATAPHEGSAG